MVSGGLLRLAGKISPLHVVVLAAVTTALAIGGLAAVSLFQDDGPSSGVTTLESSSLDLASLDVSRSSIDEQGILDTDLDGLSDSLENVVYGSDPLKWNSSGTPIPDGWLTRFGLSPVDSGVADRPATVPPAEALPAVYGNHWPGAYTATVLDIYSYGRPPDWDETVQGPFDSGLDPREWDNNGDSIPDGWLIHYGLDPLDASLAASSPAGADGLTVLEAYEHDTDPRLLDTDGDGIEDREELLGPTNPAGDGPARFPPTDPSRFDTAGTGVCDGYLASHGLDPTVPSSGYADADQDGATTVQEYQWSHARFGAEACRDGAGLDPWNQTSGGLPIPDGWLIHYDLDPLDDETADRVTQRASEDPHPVDLDPFVDINLTVMDEYTYGRPSDWLESRDGPWWGGTDPTKSDTDGDGLGDAWESAGYLVSVSTEPGALEPTTYASRLDPTKPDSDDDGLSDLQEALTGTDGGRQDTDFDGLQDGKEVLLDLGLDPLRADSAGDLLRDGERYALLVNRSEAYSTDLSYEYPGPPGVARSVTDWVGLLEGSTDLSSPPTAAEIALLLGPGGNADGDIDEETGRPIINVLDPDIDGDGLVNGLEIRPALYSESEYTAGELPGGRPASDPLNPDTDGDGLMDEWEILYGQPDFVLGRYNLDPSRWDSDGDGVGDGQEDPDGDSIEWPAFDTPSRPRQPMPTYRFDNLNEQTYNTDPNRFDSDGDGLGDGWKVFWSFEYPGLGPTSTPSVGIYYPTVSGLFQVPPDATKPIVGTPQHEDDPTSVIRTVSYLRFAIAGEELHDWETATATTVTVTRPDGTTLQLREVSGSLPFTLHDAQRLGTNPYLDDTDGDGLPDWWEGLHGSILLGLDAEGADPAQCVAGPAPDPLMPDGDSDGDQDDLLAIDEYQQGGDPLCTDTDMGGIGDGQEQEFGLSPDDPNDDQQLLNEGQDTDHDGVNDFKELVGVSHSYLDQGAPVRTDPEDPDGDGDGLLDGGDVTLPASGDVAKWFIDLGIAYEVSGQDLIFFGEETFTTDPREPADPGNDVPAGWMVAKFGQVGSASATNREQYLLGMPDWWQQEEHGPWWGGADPSLPQEDLDDLKTLHDLDGDLLDDVDGAGEPYEDPFPSANSANTLRPLDSTVHGTVPAGADVQDPDLEPMLRRALAQAYINPAPSGARHDVDHPTSTGDTRAFTCITDLKVDDAATGVHLAKGVPATVTGVLHLTAGSGGCTGDPVSGIAVQALMGSPPQLFGANFTDTDGSFTIPLNVSNAPRNATVVAGSVLRGLTSGEASWTPDPSSVAPGGTELTVRSYGNETLRRADAEVPLTLHSQAILHLTAPDGGNTGQSLLIAGLRVTDTGGSAVATQLNVTWDGTTRSIDVPEGGRDIELDEVPADRAGPIDLSIVTRSDLLTPDWFNATIPVLRPGFIELEEPGTADAGGVAHVRGQYRAVVGVASQVGVDNATVQVQASASGQTLSSNGTTGADGRFSIDVPLPDSLPSGTLTVRASTPGDDRTAAFLGGDKTLTVRGLPRFIQVSTGGLDAGDTHTVSGRLVQPDGSAVAGAQVDVQLGSATGTVVTDEDGTFVEELTVSLQPGMVMQSLSTPSTQTHAAATHSEERPVTSDTRLRLDPGIVARGGDAHVGAVLLDGSDRAVPGASVTMKWGNEPEHHLITDAEGNAQWTRPGSTNDSLGAFVVQAHFRPSVGSALGASSATSVWSVQDLVTIRLPEGPLVAGQEVPPGSLEDAGTGLPLAHTPLTVQVGAEEPLVVQTDGSGLFAIPLSPASDSNPVTMKVRAAFPGDDAYPAAEETENLRILSPVTIEPRAPSSLVAGTDAVIPVQLTDGRGLPVPVGDIQILLDGSVIGSASAGDGRVVVDVPADAETGTAILLVRYSGSYSYAETQESMETRMIAGARLDMVVERQDAGSAVVRVRLLEGETPLTDRPIHLLMEGALAGVSGTTDANGTAEFPVEVGSEGFRFLARFPGDSGSAPAAAAASVAPLEPDEVTAGTPLLVWVLAGAAVLLAGAAVVLWRIRRNPLADVFGRVYQTMVAKGPHELEILEAYRTLEDEAIAHEFIVEPAVTARTLQDTLAAQMPTRAHASLERLISLFEDARYGTEPLARTHRDTALSALKSIQRALTRQAWTGTAGGAV